MKKAILLLAFTVLSCSNYEPVEIAKEIGYLQAIGSIPSSKLSNATGKSDVPSCSNNPVVAIKYLLVDSRSGFEIDATVPVTMADNNFILDEPIELQIGTYTVHEITLLDAEGFPVYSVPHKLETRFPFGMFVDNPLPYDIVIESDKTTTDKPIALCYTDYEFGFFGEGGFDGNSESLSTLLLFNGVSSCPLRIELGSSGIEFTMGTDDPLTIPIRRLNSTVLKAYLLGTGELVTEIRFNEPSFEIIDGGYIYHMTRIAYNLDGTIDEQVISDYTFVSNYNEYTSVWEYGYDINGDGIMTANDLVYIGTQNCY
tara:strand:- start:4440 stop:5378 length:939 start_codon:yes stop_codon:yes gene_type:complete